MSRKTHEKELARARARRQAERAGQQRTRRTVAAAIVVVVAIAAIAFGLWVQGDDDPDPGATDAATGSATEAGAPTDAPTDADTGAPTEAETGAPATDEPDDAGTAAPPTDAEPCENPAEGAPEPDTELQYEDPPPAEDVADTYTVTMTTTCGEIVLELNGEAAPQTVASFVFLAEEGYYAGVPFHRVRDQFVIQGGDPTGTGRGGPGYTFEDELDLAEQVVEDNDGMYPRGTLAMANSGPDSNQSQFFIVQADPGYPFPPTYTVFGEVVEGMDVVDRIAQGPVTGESQDQAVDPVRIVSVDVAEG